MKAQSQCFTCLKKQAEIHSINLSTYLKFLESLPKDERGASMYCTPPQIAEILYEKIGNELGKKDVFVEVKAQSIKKAYEITQTIHAQDLSLQEALELCVLGNVIDYGSASPFEITDFDFAQELKKLDFGCFEISAFFEALQKASSFVMLGDNAGENLFDEVLLRRLKRDYPHLKLFYFVRGSPIINDITLADLQHFKECHGIFEIAEVIDSGVRSPGFVYTNATQEAQRIFDCADIVLSKGMGNFECLDEEMDARIFFLLKIKCQVVAQRLGFPLGKVILKQNQ